MGTSRPASSIWGPKNLGIPGPDSKRSHFMDRKTFPAWGNVKGILSIRVRRSFSLKAKISENRLIFFSLWSEKNSFFFAYFRFKRNTPRKRKQWSETKILSEKLNSLKVIFKYLDSFITDFSRGRFVHRDRYLEQHQTEKIDTGERHWRHDRIWITKVYASCPLSAPIWHKLILSPPPSLHLPTNKWRSAGPQMLWVSISMMGRKETVSYMSGWVYPLGWCSHEQNLESMGRRPLPAVWDFPRDGRWCTFDISVRKKIGGIMRRDRLPFKATISNKSRPAGSFSFS